MACKRPARLHWMCLAGPKIRFFNLLSLPQHSSPHGAPSISRLHNCAPAGLLFAPTPPPAPCLPPPTPVTEVPLGAGGRATMAAPHSTPSTWPAGGPPGADAARGPRQRRTRPARGAARRVVGGQPARRRCSTDLASVGAAWRVAGGSPPSACGIGHSISQVSGGCARPYRKRPNSLDTYQSTYRNLVLFIFLPILHGYVIRDTWPTSRIRVT